MSETSSKSKILFNVSFNSNFNFVHQGSESSSMSDSCSSCQTSDCQSSGDTSDSGINPEPFYLHNQTKTSPPKLQNANNNCSKVQNKNNMKTEEIYNPLEDLKLASEKHTKSRRDSKKKKSSDSSNEPFYLHKPDEVIYNRVQEIFNDNNKVDKSSSSGHSSGSDDTMCSRSDCRSKCSQSSGKNNFIDSNHFHL